MKNRLQALLDFLSEDPNDSFTLYGIALEYLSLGDNEKAEEYLKHILVSDPDYVPVYMQYARLKENLNQIEDARQLYLQGIEKARKTGDNRTVSEMEDFLDELQ